LRSFLHFDAMGRLSCQTMKSGPLS